MTYRNLAPWKALDELLLMPLGARVKYVRTNLARPAGGRTPHLTQDEFAAAVGAKDRHRVIGWESRGERPRDYADAIASLTEYPPAALGGDGEAELFEETLGRTLRSLRTEADRTRATLEAVLTALAEAGIRVRLPEGEPRSAATAARANHGGRA